MKLGQQHRRAGHVTSRTSSTVCFPFATVGVSESPGQILHFSHWGRVQFDGLRNARTLGHAMTHQPSVTRTAHGRALRPAPGPALLRWVLAMAVLAGFVAMHGMSSDHGVQPLAGLSAAHHPVQAPAGTGTGTSATGGSTDISRAADVKSASGAQTAAVGQLGPALVAASHVWGVSGGTTQGHIDVGCLVMLAASVLAMVLAAVLSRRTGLWISGLSRLGARLTAPRGPPRRTAAGFFMLGVLRT